MRSRVHRGAVRLNAPPRAWVTPLYAFTSFVAALLLFQVQPLLGKRLLPWFGGSPATWASCMVFFQLLLLLGYALADQLARRASPRLQLALCGAVIAAGLALLPLGPGAADRPETPGGGALSVLGLLSRHATWPCLALAMSSPLIQHWYTRATARSPYALYAWSNAGSLLGLLAYPFFVEPRWALPAQQRAWSLAFLLYAAVMLLCGALAARAPALTSADGSDAVEPASPAATPSRALQLRWAALAAVGSALLLSITNQLTLDVAAVPFLWVVPLALYLASFVIAFAEPVRDFRAWLLPLWVLGSVALAIDPFQHSSIPATVGTSMMLAALFVGCLLCHAELSRTRPEAAALSRFYLAISAGGAAGGLFVALLAPLLLPNLFELQLALAGSYALLLISLRAERDPARRRAVGRFVWLGIGLCGPLLVGSVWVHARGRSHTGNVVAERRGFYGQLRVTERDGHRRLMHGRISHGMQLTEPGKRRQPTLYYGAESGAGRVLRLHAQARPRAVGVIGLGAGTLLSYARPQDHWHVYEISPQVVELARSHFSFLADAPARVDVVVSDGRLALERARPLGLDLLVMDAFTSDAVPVHLLTVEAFEIYLRHLRPDGVLLINVSNRHVDVERVVAGAAARLGLAQRALETPHDVARKLSRVRWNLLARSPAVLDPLLQGAEPTELHGPPLAFTDDFSDLLSVLR